MHRRSFLKGGLAATAATATTTTLTLGEGFWRAAFGAPATPGVGPYGPPSVAPDANGLHLPPGFTSRVVGVSGQQVGTTGYTWHPSPDGGACFAHPDGSWTYTSNSEVGSGGAGAITFDASGTIIGARRILNGTSNNCAGGPSTWGTWLSCEERTGGWIWDCLPLGPAASAVRLDPLGQRQHEACAVDAVGKVIYTTEDNSSSRFYRWIPNDWTGPTPNFAAGGQLQALSANLTAALSGPTPATWVNVTNLTTGYRGSDSSSFNRGEGCWIDGRVCYFVTTGDSRVWAYDGVAGTLEVIYTPGGGGALTQADNITVHAQSGDCFVAEDSGNRELVLLTSPFDGSPRVSAAFMRFGGGTGSEVAGPAFSPDGTRLYVSSQRGVLGDPGTGSGTGITFEITGPFRDLRTPAPVVAEVPVPALLAATGAAALGAAAYVQHRRGQVDAHPAS